jgi:hypothetical protein
VAFCNDFDLYYKGSNETSPLCPVLATQRLLPVEALLLYEQDRRFRPSSHVSHFLERARSGIVLAVGKTQVYWPNTYLSPSSLRWRTFTWSPQIPPAPKRHRLANASAHYFSSSWVIRTSGFPHTCEWVWYGDVRHRSELDRGNDWRVNRALGPVHTSVKYDAAASSPEEMTDVWTGPYSGRADDRQITVKHTSRGLRQNVSRSWEIKRR